jgi:predicted nucleic acid-binding protein
MEPAFWDSSSLVLLCVKQQASPTAHALSKRYSLVVWWAAPVEIHSSISRHGRLGNLTSNEAVGAQVRLGELSSRWREISPSQPLRDRAEQLLDRFPLRSADALQLAAALAWTSGHPRNRPFISGDAQLLEATEQLGFLALRT